MRVVELEKVENEGVECTNNDSKINAHSCDYSEKEFLN